MPRRARSHTLRLWKVWPPCKGDRALGLTGTSATASLRGTTRVIAGQWWVYILKCGSDPPNAGHLRAIYVAPTVFTATNDAISEAFIVRMRVFRGVKWPTISIAVLLEAL